MGLESLFSRNIGGGNPHTGFFFCFGVFGGFFCNTVTKPKTFKNITVSGNKSFSRQPAINSGCTHRTTWYFSNLPIQIFMSPYISPAEAGWHEGITSPSPICLSVHMYVCLSVTLFVSDCFHRWHMCSLHHSCFLFTITFPDWSRLRFWKCSCHANPHELSRRSNAFTYRSATYNECNIFPSLLQLVTFSFW